MAPFWDVVRQFVGTRREAVTDRVALFWCTTEELHRMRLVHGSKTEQFINDGRGGARPLRVKKEDIDWALTFSPRIDAAMALEDRGAFGQALALYDAVLRETGPADYILTRIGACHVNLGEPRRGLLYLEKAASLNPDNGQIQRWIAEARRQFPGR